MLSDGFIRYLAELINGDIENLYSYKSGPKIVFFFNQHFGYNDIYGQGFPSRWFFTYSKLLEIIKEERLDDLLNIIINKRFIMHDLKLSEVEAIEREKLIVERINEQASHENYYLVKINDNYSLKQVDDDLQIIGEGGFASVFLQKSTGLVVKKLKENFVIDESIKSRFNREYRITKSLCDLNVIKVFDYSETTCSYTMERAENNLEIYIKENELSEAQKIDFIHQIFIVMEEVHNRKIIHRDISPNNVLIINEKLILSDFGLGKDLKVFSSHITINTNGLGQYLYCAPEQFMLLKEGDYRSDVYSLGRLINYILKKNPTDVTHFLRSVVEKATNENPMNRYSNAGEMYYAIRKSIEYHNDRSRIINVKENINKKKFNVDVEQYIFELDSKKMLDEIKNTDVFIESVLKFMYIDNRHALFVMEELKKNYHNCYEKFEEYDSLARLAYEILKGNFEFPVKETAAQILYYIAKNINRYYAQGLVKKIIGIGIDPFLEDILTQ